MGVFIPSSNLREGLMAQFLAAKSLMDSYAPARPSPLWLEPASISVQGDGNDCTERWRIALGHGYAANPHILTSSDLGILNADLLPQLPEIGAEDFLDAVFVESGGGSTLDVIDALNESMPAIQADLSALLARLRDAITKGQSSPVASICHSLQGVAAQYGDLKVKSLLQKWSPALKDKSRRLDLSDLAILELAVAQSLQSITLYRVALDWQALEEQS